MNDQYFIRIRGKVQGPFEAEKLRQLARRGQFSRLHEISTDAQQWSPAKGYPEFFAVPISPQPEASVATAVAEAPRSSFPINQYAAGPASQNIWYYALGGNPTGPVDFMRLSGMIGSGQLTPDATVWREGLADWVPAHTVPGLVPVSSAESPVRTSESFQPAESYKDKGQVGASIARVLNESRPWVIFIAVMVFLQAASTLIGGICQLALGGAFFTFAGLANLVNAIVIGLVGYFLISYSNGIGRFDRSRREDSLHHALASLKAFWMYIGIMLIVGMALIVIAVIMFFALIGSLRNLPEFAS